MKINYEKNYENLFKKEREWPIGNSIFNKYSNLKLYHFIECWLFQYSFSAHLEHNGTYTCMYKIKCKKTIS